MADESTKNEKEDGRPAPGEKPLGMVGIVVLGIYLFLATGACVVVLTQMWPHPTPSWTKPDSDKSAPRSWQPLDKDFLAVRCANDSDCVRCEQRAHALRRHLALEDTGNDPECVEVLWFNAVVWNERRLLFIVILSGALGGLLYSLRSFFWYVGNRTLVGSWIALYLLAPFVSALLAVIMYLVIRGGFFSAGSTVGDTSPYAFAALAALVGMFHRETAEKLRQIFEVVFTKAEVGKNRVDNPKPVLKEVTSEPSPLSRTSTSTLTISGEGFMPESVVHLDGKPLRNRVQRVNAQELRVLVDAVEAVAAGPTAIVTVTNPPPGGGDSDGVTVSIADAPEPPATT